MTTEAQFALRKVIEENSDRTRFVFVCNYLNQIIGPITSRCMTLRFKPLNRTDMVSRLDAIAKRETIPIEGGCTDAIIDVSKGDMRKAITYMQNLKYIAKIKKTIVPTDIYRIANWIPEEDIQRIWTLGRTGSFLDIRKEVKWIVSQGYPVSNVVGQVLDQMLRDDGLTDRQKALMSIRLATVEKRLIEGASEYIQLMDIFVYLRKL